MRRVAALFLLISGVGLAAPPTTDRDLLRQYFAADPLSEPRRALAVRFRKWSVGRVLGLLRRIEPHEKQTRAMQRFETAHGAYFVVPPAGYSPTKPWPLHIALHGHGSAQTGHTACERYWHGEPARHGFLLACPDLRDRWTTPRAEALVVATYRDVQQRFNVRTDRVSLGGFSGGGIGTWLIGPEYPDFFSALVARAGIPPRADEVIANLNGLPVYVVHGKGDPTIPVENSRRAADALKRLGIEHVYREETGGHEFFGRLNDTILDWLGTKTRKLRTTFRYRGKLGGPRRIVHWVELRGSGVVTIEAKLERRRRAVLRIDNPALVDGAVLHLSRKLIDVRRRKLTVVINKRTYVFPVRESVEEVLDSYDITRDLRRVSTVRVVLERRHIRP